MKKGRANVQVEMYVPSTNARRTFSVATPLIWTLRLPALSVMLVVRASACKQQ